jgi:hypothetical protein
VDHPYEHRAHYNPEGQPCHCPWGWDEDGEHLGSVKEASKLEWLEGRPDMQTPEGQQFLNLTKGLNGIGQYDQYSDFTKGADKMLPWIAREWKKGRLQIPSRDSPDYLMGFTYKNHNGENKIFNSGSAQAAQQSLEEMKKRGQGTDVMQHSVSELVPKIQDFQDWKTGQGRKDLGEVLHQFPDGWSVRRLQNQAEHEDEGDMMGHCIGKVGTNYAEQTEHGKMIYASLRDHRNVPHATMELTPNHWENTQTGETYLGHQWDAGPNGIGPSPGESGFTPKVGPNSTVGEFYGKNDTAPLPEYEDRMNQWLLNSTGASLQGYQGDEDQDEEANAALYDHPVMASHTRPLYYRWVYSPQKGVTINSNKETHPALVKYHSDLSGDINDNDLTHGFASAIGNGWRITDLSHQALDDPYIVQQVVRRLNLEDSPQAASHEGSWAPSVYDFERLHYGLPREVTQN